MKTCPKCLKSEPEIIFGIARSRYDGKTPYCRSCWTLYIQQGRWDNGVKRTLPFLDRLWNGIEICAHGRECPFCCWPWLKGRDKDGYGKISVTNGSGAHVDMRVTRTLYEIWHARPLPSEVLICHYCDFPPCSNPHHFWLGDRMSNRLDCVQKGRQAKGLTSGHTTHPEIFSTVTKEDIRTIRALHASGVSITKLSFLYPLSEFAIRRMVKYETWKHI